MTDQLAPKGVRIGHVHLHVSDLERSVAFYQDVIGMAVVQQFDEAAFLSFDGYHHHLGLNTWGTLGKKPDGVRRPGLYHFALNYQSEKDLAGAVKRVIDGGYQLEGASDHRTHLAVYISDPDGNGIELAWDRAPEFWDAFKDRTIPPEKLIAMNGPLDLQALLSQLEANPA